MHPFDGDGMVMAVSFSEDGVYFRNRYVSLVRYPCIIIAFFFFMHACACLRAFALCARLPYQVVLETRHCWGGGIVDIL